MRDTGQLIINHTNVSNEQVITDVDRDGVDEILNVVQFQETVPDLLLMNVNAPVRRRKNSGDQLALGLCRALLGVRAPLFRLNLKSIICTKASRSTSMSAKEAKI